MTQRLARPGSELRGLSAAEVSRRVADGRVNVQPEGVSRTVGEIVKSNVFTVFNLLLGVLLVVVLFVAPIQDALFGVVLVANAAIGIIQELRAKRTLDQLNLLNAPRATVIRDGRKAAIDIEGIVVDDLVVMAPGDQVVVDADVVKSDNLELDESLLTGESDTVPKSPGDRVLSGSFVASGSGIVRATAVGAEAYAARLAEEARQFTLVGSELRRGIDFILKLILWALVPVMGLLVWSQLRATPGLAEALRVSAAGMVAMIPQGLVLLTSVAFAVGVVRLGRQQVLVQELPAIEMLARVDTVCFDKTGTLTEGRMVLESIHLRARGYDHEAALGALAASESNPNATLKAIGDAFTRPPGWRPTSTVPFSSARKWSGACFGDRGSWLIGAPEVLMPEDAALAERVAAGTERGRRVLLLARCDGEVTRDEIPPGLEAVALLHLTDLIRSDAAETLQYFVEQGVTPKVISGDHPTTVGAIAREVGVPGADRVVDARTLPDDPVAFAAAIEDHVVFGRVTPHQKRAMVGALQSKGHVVAMTGDGVNDVLALKDADIGIAMGSGSSASRAVAQLVLMDGRFETLPNVVGEGRRVISNIERVANLFVTKTIYAFVLALIVGFLARPFPFVPRHLTLVGTLTIGAPAFFLALAPTTDRARPGFIARVMRFAIPVGVLAALATYFAYEVAITEDVDLIQARTMATLVLFASGMFALVINSRPLTTWKKSLIGGMSALFFFAVATQTGRTFFELALPRAVVILAAIGIIALTGSIMYAALRSVGWVQMVPDLILHPLQGTDGVPGLRETVDRLRTMSRRLIQGGGNSADADGERRPRRSKR